MPFIKDISTGTTVTHEEFDLLSDKHVFTAEELEFGCIFIDCSKGSLLDSLVKVQAAKKQGLAFYIESDKTTEFEKNEKQETIKKHFFKKLGGYQIGVTSGSTSQAKYIYSTVDLRNSQYNAVASKLRLTSDDIVYNARGVGLYTWVTIFGNAMAGKSSLILTNTISYEGNIKTIQEERPTVVFSTPTFLSKVISTGAMEKNDSIRVWYVSGSPIYINDALAMEELLVNGVVIQACSRTEGSFPFCSDPNDPVEKRLFTIGTPYNENDIKLVKNELYIRRECISPLLFGTHKFTEDGWYPTGDLLSKDDDGYYTFVGRKHLLINFRSIDINPLEVEKIVEELPYITKCCCVGIVREDEPDTKFPCLAVVCPDIKNIKWGEIKRILRNRLNVILFKCRVLPALPMTANGKVDRQKVTEFMQNSTSYSY